MKRACLALIGAAMWIAPAAGQGTAGTGGDSAGSGNTFIGQSSPSVIIDIPAIRSFTFIRQGAMITITGPA